MPGERTAPWRGVGPLVTLSAIVVLVVVGEARGIWLANLHNGLLAVTFGAVGAYVSFERPRHRLARLFLATGLVEAVLFCGRQVGRVSTSTGGRWLGWLGVWPVVVAIALVTVSVLCFPDGQLPSPRWQPVVVALVVVTVVCASMSAVWPVEYASSGLTLRHPVNATTPSAIRTAWSAIAHPAYLAFQVLWVVAAVTRWRRSSGVVRVQLAFLALATAVSLVALLAGLAVSQSPRAGLLAASLLPVAAGWAVVQGRHLTAYRALSWLSRAGSTSRDLPSDLAAAVAEALDAASVVLWIGTDTVHAVGVWPASDIAIGPTPLSALTDGPGVHTRVVANAEGVLGALSVERTSTVPLSLAQRRMFSDLASQARFVIEHIGLAALVERAGSATAIDGLTGRENDVLALIARGLSNAAICDELHLSIKTVEPIVSSIFAKLGLPTDSASNRRVLAAVMYVRAADRQVT